MKNAPRPRTIIKTFEYDQSITLAKLAKENGYTEEDFLKLLEEKLSDEKFDRMVNENKKRVRRIRKNSKDDKAGGEKTSTEEASTDMKARITGRRVVNDDTNQVLQGSTACANPAQHVNEVLFAPKAEKAKQEQKAEKVKSENKEVASEVAEVKGETPTAEATKEEQKMKNLTTMTTEELEELKNVLSTQVEGQLAEISSRQAIKVMLDEEIEKINFKVDLCEQELAKVRKQLEEAEGKLKSAEDEALSKMEENEENDKAIEEAKEKAEGYRAEIEQIEAQIAKNSTILLMVPRYQGRTTIGLKYLSTAPRKKDGVIDECVEVNNDYFKAIPLSFYESMKEAEERGYGRDVSAFAEDYAFVLMVKDFIAQGKNYKIITGKKNIRIKIMLDEILGEGGWIHD